MSQARIPRVVVSGLKRLAAVAALAQTHALHHTVQTALKWIENLEEEPCKTADKKA